MPDIHSFFIRKIYYDIKNQNIKNNTKNNIKNNTKNNTKTKETKIENVKEKEHKMNRIQSMDNFMKFSWSWTL